MSLLSKLLLGGLVGTSIGGAAGWYMFQTIPGAIGLACGVAGAICGALISLSRAQEQKS